MDIKVINILHHIPQTIVFEYKSPHNYVQRFPETDFVEIEHKPYWVGFFKLDWHHQWGKKVQQLNNSITIECWRPYGNTIDQIYSKMVDGILHKVFPSESMDLKKVGKFVRSPLMLEALQKELKSDKVILHFYGAHQDLSSWLLLKLRPVNTPVIIQHLGGWFNYFSFKKSHNILHLITYLREKRALQYIDKYLTVSKTELDFLAHNYRHLDYSFFLNGIDFSKFKPIKKSFAKESLGINSGQKVILYVGRLNSSKNVDLLIKAYKKIILKRNDVLLFLVGGYKEDEYYKTAVDAKAIIVERTDQSITMYYAAADVYVMPISNYGVREFGGIGIAPLEALAMNTPVISDNLKHCPASLDEISEMGISKINYNTLDLQIMEVIDKQYIYKNCRQIAEKYFDINLNTNKLITIYQNLYEKYYGKSI